MVKKAILPANAQVVVTVVAEKVVGHTVHLLFRTVLVACLFKSLRVLQVSDFVPLQVATNAEKMATWLGTAPMKQQKAVAVVLTAAVVMQVAMASIYYSVLIHL